MLSRTLPVRDIPANMQVTAKQIRYKGEDNQKIFLLSEEDLLTVELVRKNECTGGIVPETVDR